MDEMLQGERLDRVRERLVIAPCTGRYFPLPAEIFTTEGEWVEPGQAVAEIRRAGMDPVPVTTSFRGWLMGALAIPGQPVKQSEALFWVWSS